jgi:hypothetical protein
VATLERDASMLFGCSAVLTSFFLAPTIYSNMIYSI